MSAFQGSCNLPPWLRRPVDARTCVAEHCLHKGPDTESYDNDVQLYFVKVVCLGLSLPANIVSYYYFPCVNWQDFEFGVVHLLPCI